MHFIKVIIYVIIFEFLTCLGIESDQEKLTTVELLSDSLELAVSNSVIHYKINVDPGRDAAFLFE